MFSGHFYRRDAENAEKIWHVLRVSAVKYYAGMGSNSRIVVPTPGSVSTRI